ncbi:hypothetical protein LXL04_018429 [Taraxacum kok-saghyz]
MYFTSMVQYMREQLWSICSKAFRSRVSYKRGLDQRFNPHFWKLSSAFAKTETEFIACAREKVASSPSIDGAVASCLVAFVRDQKVIISHVGNCRAVVGVKKWGFLKYTIISEALTTEHSEKWGILDELIRDPILCSVPSFSVRDIEPRDSFIVVASDGLWNILSNGEVVQFVYDNRGKNGIAKLLVEKAMRKAEEMREKRIKDMVGSVEVGRAYDDITVVVLLLNKGKKKASLKKSDSPHLPLQLPLIIWYSTLFGVLEKSTIPCYQRQLEGQMWRI